MFKFTFPRSGVAFGALVAAAALVASGCSSGSSSDSAAPATTAAPASSAAAAPESEAPSSAVASATPAVGSTAGAVAIAFDEAATKPATAYKIAYLAECAGNQYCQARLVGMEAAAKKYGFTFKLYDANFNPQDQLAMAQDAVTQDFDAYIMAPVTAASGCSIYNDILKPTGKPVVTVDLPMCDDTGYTEGLAGVVAMQSEQFYTSVVDNAFASCGTDPCKVAAVGGFNGSDLFNLWQKGIEAGQAKYPNVEVVFNQPGDYDPKAAHQLLTDALRANPDINVIISSWDDMTRGAAAAVKQAGAENVRIYSIGGNKDAVEAVKDGTYASTALLLPFEESYYGAVAAIMALEGQPLNDFIYEADLPKGVELGSIFVTKDNADKAKPNY